MWTSQKGGSQNYPKSQTANVPLATSEHPSSNFSASLLCSPQSSSLKTGSAPLPAWQDAFAPEYVMRKGVGGAFLLLPPSFFPSSSLQGSYRLRTAPWGGGRSACPRETYVRSSHVYVSLDRPIGLSTRQCVHTHTQTLPRHTYTHLHMD